MTTNINLFLRFFILCPTLAELKHLFYPFHKYLNRLSKYTFDKLIFGLIIFYPQILFFSQLILKNEKANAFSIGLAVNRAGFYQNYPFVSMDADSLNKINDCTIDLKHL